MARRILVVLPDRFRQDCVAVKNAYGRGGISAEVRICAPSADPAVLAIANGKGCDAVLVAGPGNRSPATMLPGPFLQISSGSRIPVGWLPLVNNETLSSFLRMVERVHSRRRGPVSLAVLSQRSPRYLAVAGRVERVMAKARSFPVFQWTADRVLKEDMVAGIRGGIGCALYLGHGRPMGWVGYYGFRIHDFTTAEGGEPAGAILSLCCSTASRKRTPISFSEALVTGGIAVASFGAVRKTFHIGNVRWAVNICEALRRGASTLGDLLMEACPPEESAWKHFRIIGDPLAPLHGMSRAVQRARRIPVYA